ncbi:DUF3575 domain-containing protein [Flavobacterium sp.]|uniref:DUF3575 domain-containing protein n=1 Tax=Flavobacterium sp. TaxID=239 RepID=UPI002B4B23A8|nr:DUF3575 domain-containing protein [Flavobacterium sp.]HLF52813.1 DUF3575 domain-containing protein [Flavobacterium sp.]
MKKFFFIALLSFQFMNAQDSTSIRKNEVRFDVLSLIASSKFNISYERFLNDRFSAGLSTSYANSKKINDDFDEGYRNTMPKYEITPFVRYNLSKGISSFYFAEVFMSANGGDFKESVRLVDENNNGYYVNQKSDYFDLALGGGLGYKMYFKQKFAVEVLVGFGRNLINTDKSPDVLSRVGLNFGYRF